MEEEVLENFSFDQEEEEREEDLTDQEIAYRELKTCFNSIFEFIPYEINVILQDNPYLLKLANLLMKLLETGMESPLTQDSYNLIELSIRGLVNPQPATSVDMSSSITYPRETPNEAQDQAELHKLRAEIVEIKSNYTKLEEDYKLAQIQIDTLQQGKRDANDQVQRLAKKLAQQKHDLNEEIAMQKDSYNALAEQHEDTLTKIKLMTGVEDGLRNQLQMVQAEADGYAQQAEQLSNALNEKKDKIYQLKVDLKKAEIKISDLKTKVAAQTQASRASTPIKQEFASQNNKELLVKIESQNLEISNLKQALNERTNHIESQKQQISQQEAKIKQFDLVNNELKSKTSKYEEQIQQLNDKNRRIEEILRNRAVELTENRDILVKVSEHLSNHYTIEKLTDIPDVVEDLLLQHSQNNATPKALSIIDGLTRFINTYLLLDKADSRYLIEPCPPLVTDRKLLSQITKNINDIKQTVETEFGNKFEHYKMFDALLSAREHFTEDHDNCEFAALTVLCAANEKLRRLCIAQKKKIESFNRVFPVDSIDDSRKLFNSIAKASQRYYKLTMNFENNLRLLEEFANNTIDLIGNIQTRCIPELNLDCDVLTFPFQVIHEFSKMKETISQEALNNSQSLIQTQNELRKSLTKTEIELDNTNIEKERAEKQNKKLQNKVTKLRQKNDELKHELEKALNSQSDIESSFTISNEQRQDDKETIRALEIERNRLQEQLQQRQENSQSRYESLLAAERESRNNEIQRLQKMYNEERNHLLDEITKRDARNKAQKQKDKELISYLEKKMKDMQNSAIDGKLTKEKIKIVTTDEFTSAIIKELKRCVSVSNDWTQQKILVAIHKIVSHALDSTTEEEWKEWGSKLAGIEKSAKSSEIRKKVESCVSKTKQTDNYNETLKFEKQILLKFQGDNLERHSEMSACGIVRAILFCSMAKKLIIARQKARKNYI